MTVPALIVLAVVGLMFGSFLNVCISRLPMYESVISPRSRCRSCRMAIRWYDNIPVLSYLMLGGQCRDCGAPIGLRYPIIELATAGAFVVQGLVHGTDLPLLVVRLIFTALLIVLFGADLETERLPNVVTVPGMAVGLVASLALPPGIVTSAIGAALGGGVLLVIRWTWKLATGVDGMGLGDVKMLAMIGAFLGWRLVLVVLFLSSIAGAVVGIVLIAFRQGSLKTSLPFGTLLALAAFIASLVGDRIAVWYLAGVQ